MSLKYIVFHLIRLIFLFLSFFFFFFFHLPNYRSLKARLDTRGTYTGDTVSSRGKRCSNDGTPKALSLLEKRGQANQDQSYEAAWKTAKRIWLDGRLETIDLSNEYGLSSPVIFVKLANQLILPAFDFTGNGIVFDS